MHPWDCPQLSPALCSLASLLSMEHVSISFKVLKLAHFHCPKSTDPQSSLSSAFTASAIHRWVVMEELTGPCAPLNHPVVAGSLSLTWLSSFLCAPQALFPKLHYSPQTSCPTAFCLIFHRKPQFFFTEKVSTSNSLVPKHPSSSFLHQFLQTPPPLTSPECLSSLTPHKYKCPPCLKPGLCLGIWSTPPANNLLNQLPALLVSYHSYRP